MKELRRDFFLSPNDQQDEEFHLSHTDDEKSHGLMSLLVADTLKKKIQKTRKKIFNWENLFLPETASECLEDARIRRAMIRRAARYVIEKVKDEDTKKEAEIKARNDEKEINAWFNNPRYHDKKLLDEARLVVEREFLKPIRDEKKRQKVSMMYRSIFKNVDSFKIELRALSKERPLHTAEVKKHYVPNTVSIESYMYALDRGATIDMAVSDMVGKNSQMKKLIAKERQEANHREEAESERIHGYLHNVREMVKATGILEEDAIDPELQENRRKKKCMPCSIYSLMFIVLYAFRKQLIQCVD